MRERESISVTFQWLNLIWRLFFFCRKPEHIGSATLTENGYTFHVPRSPNTVVVVFAGNENTEASGDTLFTSVVVFTVARSLCTVGCVQSIPDTKNQNDCQCPSVVSWHVTEQAPVYSQGQHTDSERSYPGQHTHFTKYYVWLRKRPCLFTL